MISSEKNVWESWLNKPIIKKSGKPFKSGNKEGVPLMFTINPHSNKRAFKMDDGSVVDCHQCMIK